jgi:DNA-binding HxlR family transcriptional regulator
LHNESQSAAITFEKQAMSVFSEFACSIARTVDVVGEWWTLLILRDLFAGITRYDALQRDLGIASNILAARLKTLREAQLVERTPDPDDARRWCYALTARGRELYPVLLALMAWGDKWLAEPGRQPVLVVHRTCGEVTAAVPSCSVCGKPLALEELDFQAGPGGRAGPGTASIGAYLGHAARPHNL